MAKKSMIEKNKRRMRQVERYAERREELKAAAKDSSLTPEERFNARLKLAKLPRCQSAASRIIISSNSRTAMFRPP